MKQILSPNNEKYTKIVSNPFSEVFRLTRSSGVDLYFKFFKHPKKYIINGKDLSPLFKRGRMKVSMFLHKTYMKNKLLRNYLPRTLAYEKQDFIITESCKGNILKFDAILVDKNSDFNWLETLKEITTDFDSKNKVHKTYSFLHNSKVSKLKIDLQIRKPLIAIFGSNKTSIILKKLGKNIYLSHGDLQPKNIIVSQSEVKVIDYEEAFIGPFEWDIGFLWGNCIYYCVKDKVKFKKIFEEWVNQISLKKEGKDFNFVVISIASVLMRINDFPILELTSKESTALKLRVKQMSKYLNI
jgi:hypothetical protein